VACPKVAAFVSALIREPRPASRSSSLLVDTPPLVQASVAPATSDEMSPSSIGGLARSMSLRLWWPLKLQGPPSAFESGRVLDARSQRPPRYGSSDRPSPSQRRLAAPSTRVARK